jgi:ankyrin repeat protein
MRITFGHLVCLFGCFCGLAGFGIFGEDKLGGMTVRDAFKDPLVAEMVEAASSGRLSVVDAKIKAGANVNYVGTGGITPLLWVIPMNHHAHDFSGVRRLLEAGADPNYEDPRTQASAVYLAAGGDIPSLLELVLKFRGNPNLVGPRNETPLMTAVMQFRGENIDLLLKYGADVNAHDKFGASAPNTASDLGRFDIVARFLDKGFSYNLEKLAKAVQSRPVPPNSDAQRWKDKVLKMLEQRGVNIPPPPKVSTGPHVAP